eukprot:scaffold9588_cov64-Phaeocystis_antarctica.AAC.1
MKSASGNTGGGEWGPASGDWGGKRGLGRPQGHLFHLHPNSACNNAVAVQHPHLKLPRQVTALCLARVASLPRVASGARCLPALLALLRCPPCTARLPPPCAASSTCTASLTCTLPAT